MIQISECQNILHKNKTQQRYHRTASWWELERKAEAWKHASHVLPEKIVPSVPTGEGHSSSRFCSCLPSLRSYFGLWQVRRKVWHEPSQEAVRIRPRRWWHPARAAVMSTPWTWIGYSCPSSVCSLCACCFLFVKRRLCTFAYIITEYSFLKSFPIWQAWDNSVMKPHVPITQHP